ncbi:hypothetical protein CEP52_014827 [Fusarium oligoseptatum]|uniref:Uncharacterized protein n=1 Tax=Fusarium oligoseptatum TaxID=2604345 RepID=A0A428SIX7_9HYPO|nr:hypothetical protein CEP52_014827 [Fusarium oligoseptatum]
MEYAPNWPETKEYREMFDRAYGIGWNHVTGAYLADLWFPLKGVMSMALSAINAMIWYQAKRNWRTAPCRRYLSEEYIDGDNGDALANANQDYSRYFMKDTGDCFDERVDDDRDDDE